jgi:hypothetical protein
LVRPGHERHIARRAAPLPTPDDYLRLFKVAADPAGKAAFFAERPKIAADLQNLLTTVQAPKSLAETAYNAIHASHP